MGSVALALVAAAPCPRCIRDTPGDSKPGLQQKEAPMVGEARLGASGVMGSAWAIGLLTPTSWENVTSWEATPHSTLQPQ